MFVDFVLDGRGYGEVGQMMEEVRYDPGMLRPFVDRKGRKCVNVATGKKVWSKVKVGNQEVDMELPERKTVLIKHLRDQGLDVPVWNAVSMRRDQWIKIDDKVQMAARQRLRLVDDLMSSSRVGGFDGMATMTYEYDAVTDPGEARVDMDAITDGRTDSPLYKTRSIPLPITHSDFWFSARRIAVSGNKGVPLPTTMAEAAGRRIGEMVEKTAIGVVAGTTFGTNTNYMDGTSTVYGLTTHPNRTIKSDLTVPTGTNPSATIDDLIEMRESLYSSGFYGPFVLYHTPAFDRFLDQDYTLTGGNVTTQTLRARLREIENIQDVRRLDFWTGGTYQMILIQMNSEVVEMIDGMGLTTVQWDSQGGMRKNFKVMVIWVPLFRADYNGNMGEVHATTA